MKRVVYERGLIEKLIEEGYVVLDVSGNETKTQTIKLSYLGIDLSVRVHETWFLKSGNDLHNNYDLHEFHITWEYPESWSRFKRLKVSPRWDLWVYNERPARETGWTYSKGQTASGVRKILAFSDGWLNGTNQKQSNGVAEISPGGNQTEDAGG